MFRKSFFYGLLVIGIIGMSLMVIILVPKLTNKREYCYSMLSPVSANSNESSTILESGCFNTFAESIQAATGGRVHLDPSINSKDVTDEMVNH
jgi:hypothetical protein